MHNRLLKAGFPVLSSSASADPADALVYYTLACKYSLVVYCIGKACRYTYLRDNRNSSRYTLEFNVYSISLSINRSDWLARLVCILKLGEQCLQIPVCWFLRQHIFWHARWDTIVELSSWIFQWTQLSYKRRLIKLWNMQWSTGLIAWRARRIIQSMVWMLVKSFISLIIIPHSRWFFSTKHRLRCAVINIMHRLRSRWLVGNHG